MSRKQLYNIMEDMLKVNRPDEDNSTHILDPRTVGMPATNLPAARLLNIVKA